MYLKALELENIKSFENLSLDFERPDKSYAGFNVFVGGNSAGKSTLLKCIAMAMSGPVTAAQQLVTPLGWLRRGTTKGVIELTLRWDQQKDKFTSGRPLVAEAFNVPLLAKLTLPN